MQTSAGPSPVKTQGQRHIVRGFAQLGVALCTLALAAPALAQSKQTIYRCVDAKGKTYVTQTPPPECLGKSTQELSSQGRVIRENVVLTPEQQALQEAEKKRKDEQEQQAREERRKNAALLNTYSSEKDIEEARTRALRQAEEAIKQTEKRITEAEKRRKDFEREKEFYAKKGPPPKLLQDIQNAEIELKNQHDLLDAKRKEIGTINARYDEDKRRYLELTKGATKK
jgi:DNA repair exonuclease SbcCD ATPase subunit